jgi:hypothetical protein
MFSCTKRPHETFAPVTEDQVVQTRDGTGTDPVDDVPPPAPTSILDSAEYKASILAIKVSEIALSQAGHKLPQIINGDEITWLDHEIEEEVGITSFKKRPWEPGYVVSYYREFMPALNISAKPVFKFLDGNSWPAISKLMNSFLDAVETHYATYENDMPKKEITFLEGKYELVEQTFANYRAHLLDQVERGKIREMTWAEILKKTEDDEGNPSLKYVYLCDKSLDLLYVSSLVNSDNQELLQPLLESKKVRPLKTEASDLFQSDKVFNVYENYLIFIN